MQETHPLRIPGDWRRPAKRESFALAWHEDLGYGELLPRPTRAGVEGAARHDAGHDGHGGQHDGRPLRPRPAWWYQRP